MSRSYSYYSKPHQHDPSRQFHEPPYHRHFSDKTALNIREKVAEPKELPKRYYHGEDHDAVCGGYHKHAKEPHEDEKPLPPPSHDRRLLELEIHRLERQYAEARSKYVF